MSCGAFLLHLEDGLLSEEDHELLFAGYVLAVFDDIVLNKRLEVIVLMRSEEVIIDGSRREFVVGEDKSKNRKNHVPDKRAWYIRNCFCCLDVV